MRPLDVLADHIAQRADKHGAVDVRYELRDVFKAFDHLCHLLERRELRELGNVLRVVVRAQRILMSELRHKKL